MIKAILLVLPLAGCVTVDDREFAAILGGYYSRAEVDAINAEVACRNLARTLIQIERCRVRPAGR